MGCVHSTKGQFSFSDEFEEMSIVLAIKTDKSVYVAGDVIKGTVAVHVDKVSG